MPRRGERNARPRVPAPAMLLLLSVAAISSSAALASAPRSSAPLGVVEVAPLSLTLERDGASRYVLFAGDELAQALAQGLRHRDVSRFALGLDVVEPALAPPTRELRLNLHRDLELLAVELLRGPPEPGEDLRRGLFLGDPETRIGGSGLFLGSRIGEKERLRLDAHWGCGLWGRELAADQPQDPLGLSQSDFHFGLTYFLAQLAGYSPGEAMAVANEDARVDVARHTNPEKQAAAGNWAPVYEDHFPIDRVTGKVKENSSAARAKVDAANDLIQLGHGLHVLQDSFSHAGAYPGNLVPEFEAAGGGGIPRLGQVTGDLRDPRNGITHFFTKERVQRFGWKGGIQAADWTFMAPDKAMREARATFDALVDWRVKRGYLSSEEAGHLRDRWEKEIAPRVRGFAVADSVEKKKDWFKKNAPGIGELVDWKDVTIDLARGK